MVLFNTSVNDISKHATPRDRILILLNEVFIPSNLLSSMNEYDFNLTRFRSCRCLSQTLFDTLLPKPWGPFSPLFYISGFRCRVHTKTSRRIIWSLGRNQVRKIKRDGGIPIQTLWPLVRMWLAQRKNGFTTHTWVSPCPVLSRYY